jgi:hypothetical protein
VTDDAKLAVAARWYAARGWRVFPLKPREKTPLLQEWQIVATTDPGTIDKWWTQFPTANVGIACGKESGLFVLDVDDDKGGKDQLFVLTEDNTGLPDTVEVITKRGWHLYYAWPVNGSTIRNSAGKLGTGAKTAMW